MLAVEPWWGGSHERFLAGWVRHSGHDVEVLGLSGRQWRWRMRDGARQLALRAAERPRVPDVLLASDYLDVPGFYGFLPGEWSDAPLVLYFHENQLTYPRAPGRPPPDPERDRHFAYTHVLSCLRAERVVFNSRFHRDEFRGAAREFLRRLPRDAPRAAFERRLDASTVIGPGVELDRIPLGPGGSPGAPLAVSFPHRWEHDKDPLTFLSACRAVLERGLELELHLAGERFGELPPGVADALAALGPRIARDGFHPDFDDYARSLGEADLVVSTARHEFYGIAVLEALAAGCAPLLPDRLSYPELLGPTAGEALYADEAALVTGLCAAAREPERLRSSEARTRWRDLATRHSAARTAERLDALLGSDRRTLEAPPG